MEMIIQGDNKPIVLELDESAINLTQFSAVLFDNDNIYTTWGIDDIKMDESVIMLPLAQEDTMKLRGGYVDLEVKFVTDGDIEFCEKISFVVKKRKDKTIFSLGGASDGK